MSHELSGGSDGDRSGGPANTRGAQHGAQHGAQDGADGGAAARRARLRLVEPMYAALAADEEPTELPVAPERGGSSWLGTTLVALVPAALVLAWQGLQLDGDTYHYVEYARKLAAGIPHTSSLHEAAPKPLPILVHGALYALTGSFAVLAWVWVVLAGCAAAAVARTAAALAPRALERTEVTWVTLALLTLHPIWVHQTLGGSAVTLQVLCLALAARSALRPSPSHGETSSTPPRRFARPLAVGVWLALAGLSRPDAWPIALACVLAAPLLALTRWVLRRRGTEVSWRPQTWALAGLVGLVAVPLWLAFDRALTGDAWFSFRSTTSYGERHAAAETVRPLWQAALRYGPRLASNLAEVLHGGIAIAALLGIARLARRRPLELAVSLLAALAVAAFYLLPFRSGLPLLPRFLVVPIAVAAALAAFGAVRLAPLILRSHPRFALLATVAVVGAQEVHALKELLGERCRLDAAATAGLLEALDALPHPPTIEQPLVVAARRKGLAVLALGVDSAAVTTLRHIDPEAWAEDPGAFGPVVFDPRDEVEPYVGRWSAVLGAPERSFASGTVLHAPR